MSGLGLELWLVRKCALRLERLACRDGGSAVHMSFSSLRGWVQLPVSILQVALLAEDGLLQPSQARCGWLLLPCHMGTLRHRHPQDTL